MVLTADEFSTNTDSPVCIFPLRVFWADGLYFGVSESAK